MKWAEVEPMNNTSEENIKQFIFHNIIWCFGDPLQIITDNKTQITGHKLKEFCGKNKLNWASPQYTTPKQVKVTNRTKQQYSKEKSAIT